jgi:hypothetical protein
MNLIAGDSVPGTVTNASDPEGGAPVKIGNMLVVKVHYRQGLASQSGSESWTEGSNSLGQALTGERIGWVLSHEKGQDGVPSQSLLCEGNIVTSVKASALQAPRGQRPRACAETYCARTGRACRCPSPQVERRTVSGSQ